MTRRHPPAIARGAAAGHDVDTVNTSDPIIPDPETVEKAQKLEEKKSSAKKAAFETRSGSKAAPSKKASPTPSKEVPQPSALSTAEGVLENSATGAEDPEFPIEGDLEEWGIPEAVDRAIEEEIKEDRHSKLLISVEEEIVQKFAKGYADNRSFRDAYARAAPTADQPLSPSHYRRAESGLLYFADTD
ncbi:hypothetical protein BDZ89DRAFT_1145895 [Hymenopellis radicata]|nr:hypothetical protein BDZ89DRAFT_1145895 [Hymenopellis radicata]